MKSIEQRRQVLNIMIRQLKRELDSLRQPGCVPSCVNVDTDNDRDLRPNGQAGAYNGNG